MLLFSSGGCGRASGRCCGQAVVVPDGNPAFVSLKNETQVTRMAGVLIEKNGVLAGQEESVRFACMVHKHDYMVTPCNHVVLCGLAHRHRSGLRNEFGISILNYVGYLQCRL